MRWIHRLRSLFRRHQLDRELTDELQFHVEMRTRENIAAGMSPEEARYATLRQFGNLGAVREETREMWGWSSVETLLQDLRFGLRMLAKSPGFSATLALVLGLGIGAATVMFSVVDGVMLRPLSFPHPEQLMAVSSVTYPTMIDPLDWWGHNHSFDQLAECRLGHVSLTVGERTEPMSAAVVSANFFLVLQASPALGRAFLREDEERGNNRVVVLSHGLWLENSGGDRSVLGRVIRLNGIPHTVIGVMPPGFTFPAQARLWVPRISPAEEGTSPRPDQNAVDHPGQRLVFGRLKPGITLEQADQELTARAHLLQETYGGKQLVVANKFVRVHPLRHWMARASRQVLLALFTAVCVVLLIAWVNAANMRLARAVARRKEVAVRLCLGASRWRVIRQLVIESTLAAIVAGGLGVVMALWGVNTIRAMGPKNIPGLEGIRVDFTVLGFALCLSVLTGIIVGLAPAVQTLAAELTSALKEEGTGSTGRLGQRVREILVVVEVALALTLLTGAGLVIRSLYRLTGTELGFNPANVLTLDLIVLQPKAATGTQKADSPAKAAIPAGREGAPVKRLEVAQNHEETMAEPSRLAVSHHQLLERIRALPGVLAVATVDDLPLKAEEHFLYLDVGGKPAGDARFFRVSGDYFRAIGIPLLSGRSFTEQEVEEQSKRVVIISRSLARSLWGDGNALGETLKVESSSEDAPREIVGVVGDVTSADAGSQGSQEQWQFYLPGPATTMVVRTASNLQSAAGPLRKELESFDKTLTAFNIETMDEVISTFMAPPRFRSLLFGLFAGFAFVLALLGLYGVVSFSVASRTHEIGVRMSMGASPHNVLQMVLGESARLALYGVALGLLGAVTLTKLISSLMFGITPDDPLTLAAAALLLFGGAVLACVFPALKATRVEPTAALRYE